MPSPIRNIIIDCADPFALAEFWSKVIDVPVSPESSPGGSEAFIDTPQGNPGLLFLRVPENKVVKNRIHLDLTPEGASRDEELRRLLGLGATFLKDFRTEDGGGWVTLADPEGNEFCLERDGDELSLAGEHQGE
ncbi:VOC family protein [Salinactinospora qingdaonensis]|uniref:VOC family protein n=1 Tax=Salinactinospora qingdaonensis TaxID=702744 RepID=A0ABP7FR12_9ACTN